MSIDFIGSKFGAEIKHVCEGCNNESEFVVAEMMDGGIMNTKTGQRYVDVDFFFYCKNHYPFNKY